MAIYTSDAVAPQDFQREVLADLTQRIDFLTKQQGTSRPRKREELGCAIAELRLLRGFIAAVRFAVRDAA
ncbi:MAG TPA: hypothetical protein VNL71_05840 [Chloroflexota bacterium]|nr:hypothetical protein [Chloroflexota bacterium]